MPPATARDCFVVLFDANTSDKSQALSVLFKTCFLKDNATKDIAQVFFMNVNQTENDKNIHGLVQLETTCFKAPILMQHLDKLDEGECNWLEALELAVNNVAGWYQEAGVITLQILFITDFTNCKYHRNDKVFKNIIQKLNKYDIFLYIVGPPVKPNKTIMYEEDIANWKENLSIDEKNENLALAKQIIQNTKHSIMADYYTGVHLFFAYKYQKGMQPWIVPLTFFHKLDLPVSTVRVLKHELPYRPEGTKRKMRESKWVSTDQPPTEYDESQLTKGVSKHDTFVKIETDDMFKVEGERSFMVLGITDSSYVPEYLMHSEATYMVMPDPKALRQELELLFVLIDQLAEQGKYVIARRVFNRNNIPKFMALIPRPDKTPKCFLMVELPYADDVEHEYVEQDLAEAPKTEIDEEVFSFLDSINISKKTNVREISLLPTMMYEQVCLDDAHRAEARCSAKVSGLNPQKLQPDCLNIQKNEKLENLVLKWPARPPVKKPNEEDDGTREFDNLTYAFGANTKSH